MEKAVILSAEDTEGFRGSGDLRRTAAGSERALNGAILAAEISQGSEEYLGIFDHFYAEDVQATTDALEEPVKGRGAVRSRLARFLVSLHVFAEIGGVAVKLRSSPIAGDRLDETHSGWTLELRGVIGACCLVAWHARRRWWAGRVISEHHYGHEQTGGPLTFGDLRLNRGAPATPQQDWQGPH